MPKKVIIKGNFFDDYFKNKYTLLVIIFTLGVITLLYYIFVTKKQTKIIENYSTNELKQIAEKLNQSNPTSEKSNMDLSGIFKMDLTDIIKRLFGPRCLAGCMSPNSMNRNDEMCKRTINDNGAVLECPWRCNIPDFTKQMDSNLMFKKDILTKNIKMCSVESENIDCAGCVPLRIFD